MTLEDTIKLYLPHMEGWTTPERGIEMAHEILKQRPITVVEIGVFGGRSLLAQALALRENGMGMIYGIDPWRNDDALEGESEANRDWWSKLDLHEVHRKTMMAIWPHNLDNHVCIIRAASQHVAHLFPFIDILTIDGNHSEIASMRDVKLYVPSVRSGGLIWFDDSDWATTQPALQKLSEYADLERSVGTCRLYRRK